ncbi:hypothetical protein B0I37DRAFT_372933 [Chaetomium sp. MPI-CAGE-AT-0009]|nr:hypothetical protein B0I37DRAFT_372933 [Chaetomium sp. MPI-CAGE-AT-0009]
MAAVCGLGVLRVMVLAGVRRYWPCSGRPTIIRQTTTQPKHLPTLGSWGGLCGGCPDRSDWGCMATVFAEFVCLVGYGFFLPGRLAFCYLFGRGSWIQGVYVQVCARVMAPSLSMVWDPGWAGV